MYLSHVFNLVLLDFGAFLSQSIVEVCGALDPANTGAALAHDGEQLG